MESHARSIGYGLMLATVNSEIGAPFLVRVMAILAFCCPGVCGAAEPVDKLLAWKNHVQEEYRFARARLDRDWSHHNALDFVRAAFDRGEIATDSEERAAVARKGLRVSRQLLDEAPNMAAAHYYYGMNLAQLAQTRRMGALKLLGEMEETFKTARDLDEQFDYAGPDRNLGLLYLQAPGWPLSIGNRSKARKHLERAVELAPHFPENRLNLLEAHLKWGNSSHAKREASALEKLWPEARKSFAGTSWIGAWVEWEERWETNLEKMNQRSPALERVP
jgi:tetratricopeptide (TPR) repeat protein